jgi:2-keto-4-pentenoate hydratase/2-oxohepta-3-ene-1,7-dioic acid hydratase in catechol pathway
VDTSRDVGIDTFDGRKIEAFVINGSIFDGIATNHTLTVERLLSPISKEDCNCIGCLGLNYKDHAKEADLALPKAPVLFTTPRTALVDPYPAAITIPKCAQDGTSNYEAELCVVISKTSRDISEEEALDYVLGYTCSNDVSARALQFATSQWGFSKGLDGSCPIGKRVPSLALI